MGRVTNGYDGYWRLDDYEDLKKDVLATDLRSVGYEVAKSASKSKLVELKQRVDRGLLCYQKCTAN